LNSSKRALYYPIAGLVSILIAFLLSGRSGLNVHSGEIFLYVFILFAFGLLIPFICFFKALDVVFLEMRWESFDKKAHAVILTAILGILIGVVLVLAFLK